ncbi:hypothetical protein QR685DRAFT_576103 [Neurospora intermedia]|uniref:Questionable protein n=1 Tax=Neurospora intermedia TaxID=5142 RepID=A0ABR3CYW3_NEUIN
MTDRVTFTSGIFYSMGSIMMNVGGILEFILGNTSPCGHGAVPLELKQDNVKPSSIAVQPRDLPHRLGHNPDPGIQRIYRLRPIEPHEPRLRNFVRPLFG